MIKKSTDVKSPKVKVQSPVEEVQVETVAPGEVPEVKINDLNPPAPAVAVAPSFN